jgi:hypothetical protein
MGSHILNVHKFGEIMGNAIMWAVSGNLWAVKEENYLVSHALVSYTCGILA